MIKIQLFVNQPLSSNCFIVYDDEKKKAIAVDPGSEDSVKEIEFIKQQKLSLEFILLTHEHIDHVWGVNTLVKYFPTVKVICSSLCRENLPNEARFFFQLYFDNSEYIYDLCRVDKTTEEIKWHLDWYGHNITFIPTPGHTPGSICIVFDDVLFGGDTILQFKPYIRKRNGGSLEQYNESMKIIMDGFSEQTLVYPGHGDTFTLQDYNKKIVL